ncbi:MAG: sigma-54-dependent Fis family transcriptional regulator [Acidobacteria bacterium]|nr:sigma-54-dependent Fis family transcriptional regulator [Acidobacteriota bacterium]
MPRILIADDQPDIREALRLLLKGEGFAVQTADSPATVRQELATRPPSLLLMDLNYRRDTTSGTEGLALLQEALAQDPLLPVVVMTGYATIELAVEAMRLGARDFIQKPWDNARLLSILRTQLELAMALRASKRLEAENALLRGERAPALVARSRGMVSLLELAAKVAPSDAPLLITGENGTGKSLLAEVIHRASRRAAGPFLTLNAGGLSEGVLESELFGHVKGAFTDARQDRAGRFELAEGGTLFLDEVGNAPSSLQSRLLRVLETGAFERVGSSRTLKADVRLISATNADLEAEVASGRFRQDLRFRLNTVELHLPPLRERLEDIPLLANHFLALHAAKYHRSIHGFEPEALQALARHTWPGNVRELSHAVERSVLVAAGPGLRAEDLLLQAPRPGTSLEDMGLEDMEALLIRKALHRHGNATAAAEALGLSRSAFYRRLQKLGIQTG